MIGRILHLTGVPLGTVFTAGNGDECLDILNRNWIDLLFLDINMPKMDGIDVLRTLSSDVVLRRLPVIVVSAESNRSRIADVNAPGLRAFIGKPFTPEKLRGVVLDAIQEVRAE